MPLVSAVSVEGLALENMELSRITAAIIASIPPTVIYRSLVACFSFSLLLLVFISVIDIPFKKMISTIILAFFSDRIHKNQTKISVLQVNTPTVDKSASLW